VDGLKSFFERFKSLNVHSSSQLDDLVAQAQKAVQGVSPQDLRDSDALRKQVATQLQSVSATLETLLVDQPRRKILRTGTAPVTTGTLTAPGNPVPTSGGMPANPSLASASGNMSATMSAPPALPINPSLSASSPTPRPVESKRQVA